MLPFDLHVLGLPPAFTLSQDQTLHLSITTGPKTHQCFECSRLSRPKLLKTYICMLASKSFGLCVERSANGQLSTRRTPAQVTCAHCQRSKVRPQRLPPSATLSGCASRTPQCPTEPHILQRNSWTSTPWREIFRLPVSQVSTRLPRPSTCLGGPRTMPMDAALVKS